MPPSHATQLRTLLLPPTSQTPKCLCKTPSAFSCPLLREDFSQSRLIRITRKGRWQLGGRAACVPDKSRVTQRRHSFGFRRNHVSYEPATIGDVDDLPGSCSLHHFRCVLLEGADANAMCHVRQSSTYPRARASAPSEQGGQMTEYPVDSAGSRLLQAAREAGQEARQSVVLPPPPASPFGADIGLGDTVKVKAPLKLTKSARESRVRTQQPDAHTTGNSSTLPISGPRNLRPRRWNSPASPVAMNRWTGSANCGSRTRSWATRVR